MADEPPLTPANVAEILEKISPISDQVVLIGGQAVNFWAAKYESQLDELDRGAYTSKDIDLFGNIESVRQCARLLGGRATVAEAFSEHPNLGVIEFQQGEYERKIDFLRVLPAWKTKSFTTRR